MYLYVHTKYSNISHHVSTETNGLRLMTRCLDKHLTFKKNLYNSLLRVKSYLFFGLQTTDLVKFYNFLSKLIFN